MKQKTHLIPNTSLHRSNPPDPDPPEDEMVVITALSYSSSSGIQSIPISTFILNGPNSSTVSVPPDNGLLQIYASTSGYFSLLWEFNDTTSQVNISVSGKYLWKVIPGDDPVFQNSKNEDVIALYDTESAVRNSTDLTIYPASRITFDFTA